MPGSRRLTREVCRFACGALLVPVAATALELPPLGESNGPGGNAAIHSRRTLSLGLEIDRDQVRLLAYTIKDRPFVGRRRPDEPRPFRRDAPLQIEAVLLGPAGVTFTHRAKVGLLCLEHGPESEPHVQGDTVLAHRDSVLIELPEVAGFGQVEIAWYEGDAAAPVRRPLGVVVLAADRFTAAAGRFRYQDLAFAGEPPPPPPPGTSGQVWWPEDFGDPDIYRVWGNEAETTRRINIVLVPDGYRYAQKALMETHAQSLVNGFRAKTPYAEHDPFLNFILVYAYSTESGTDQCDCSIVVDTAMNTRFPQLGTPPYPCGDFRNRCLYYSTFNGGPDCDSTTSPANIVAAELRAPADDMTVVMVNTSRYGGCGGTRSVYAAANASAAEIAFHELGHSLAGLADEYGGFPSCGSDADGPNVSLDPVNGDWPEWIADLGAPWETAKYYNDCIYRPVNQCAMGLLGLPFCAVCNQHYSLTFFDHFRIAPTAPIEAQSPPSPVATEVGDPTGFSVDVRLGVGGVTNQITWFLEGPGYPEPTPVASDVTEYIHVFTAPGTYTMTCEVIADTNFIKPPKNDANVDQVAWLVEVDEPVCDPAPTFSGIASATDLDPCALDGVALAWSPAVFGPAGGAYDVYRDGVRVAQGVTASPYIDLPGDSSTHSFRVVAVSADCGLEDGNSATRDASDQVGDAAPVFTGIASATDLDPCALDGVEVAWSPAVFGPAGGAYDVYRDGVRVAQGVTASPYTDLPGDSSTHSFRVVAVSADCGLEDGNSATRDASDQIGDDAPVFSGIASATDLDPCALDGVEVAWSPAVFGPAGGAYDVYRDGVRVAQGVPASPYTDLPGNSATHAYRVVAVSADCGLEDGNSATRDASDQIGDDAPVFSGIASATDLDPCALDGIDLSWDPAVFGPAGGAYDVYRDGVRVAQGVTASPYTDLPGDSSTHAFRVVAVSADCGLEDGNSATRDASDQVGDAAPVFTGIASATDLDACALDGVEVAWSPAVFGPAGGAYDVYRDGVPIAQGVTASPYIDLPGDSSTHSFRVVAVSADCGLEDGNSATRDASDQVGDAAPVFSGIASATDLDPCALDGVEVAWSPAVFGPAGGAYDVYRDGVRVAQGVTASPYTDLPGDSSTHSFRVVAVSADCGLEDGNSATRDASDQVGDAAPVFTGIASATDLDACALDGVEVAWSPAVFGPAGGAYDVYRDGVPIAQGVTASPYTDLPGDSSTHSFRVVAVSADCGLEDGNSATRDASDQVGDAAPVFTGIASATDLDPCALDGVEVAWSPAVFGPAGGAYDVYRDGVRVAQGVTASPYTDLPGDSSTHSFRVVAVSADCGLEDGNSATRDASDQVGDAAPVFTGIASATDLDPCALDGVEVAWSPAVFGPAGGAYDVYRDGVRVAQGVTASPYIDLPGDSSTHSFRVVAVSADCGLEDGNSATRDASDQVGDDAPVFSGIASATDLDPCALDGVEVAWSPAVFGPAGGAYDVYRDGVRVAQGVTASPYTDLPGDSSTHSFRVVAVSADCGLEEGNSATRDASDQVGDAAPVFSGIASATDLDPCALDGVALAWSPAVFGPAGGAYDVYRDGVRVAQGVPASPYTDLPGDSSVHAFRVVAVSADCGLEDGNSATRDASDQVGDAAPVFSGIASATDLDPCALDGVEVAWSPAVFGPAGGAYDVYRDGVRVAQGVTGSPYLDLPGDSAIHAYRVVAVSTDCDREEGNSATRDASDQVGDAAPVFAGIVSATDRDSCRDDGVALAWDPAVFGPAGGAYDVYRDGVRIAQGVTASPYLDLPGDSTTHTYRVVAVSTDCGLEDGNSATRDASDQIGDRPVFSGIVSATDVDSCGDDGIELAWDPATFGPDGGAYDVYRDGVRIAQGVTASPYLDLPGDSTTHAYRVVAISADCGLEDGNSVTRDAADDAGDPAPVFAGIASATDLDPCALDGVEIAWSPAVFGPAGGAYDVYRDGVRVAQGVTASPYIDLPGDSANHAYRVVAVSTDCDREDGNSATRDASDQVGDAAPVFAGIVSATDRDSCRDDGVALAWDPAVFGPAGGAYDVYRDGVRIAQGVTASPYLDLPGDSTTHTYRVVAVSADCGLEDGNPATRDASDQIGDRPVFSGIVSATDLDSCGEDGIELAWDPATFGPDGGAYDVYRDGVRIAQGVTASPYLDLPGDSTTHAYRVVAVSADCGLEDGNSATRDAADDAGDPAPVFAGIASTTDLDPCTLDGIEIAWDPAVFGPAGGAYDVYRDGVRVAQGVTASPYIDLPGDSANHAYRVVAVSTDCDREDGNSATRDASDKVGDAAPVFAGIVSATDRDSCRDDGVELAWDPAVFGPAGGAYDVYRDGVRIAQGVTASPYLDLPGDSTTHTYRVVAISADCGLEDGNPATRDASDQVGDAAPVFAGIVSATDRDSCGDNGVELAWDPATFGPAGGAYDVYRDGVRVAQGVTASPYLDLPGDSTTHTYRVVAVSADCGLEDGNPATRDASDQIGDRPVFSGIVSATDLDSCGDDGIELAWDPATFGPDGGAYDVYRDGVRIAQGVTASPYLDLPGDSTTHAYRVVAISADCGLEDGNSATRDAADDAGDPAPVFAGIASATDLDPCALDGIALAWDPAVFGPAGGAYDVYRDGVRIAQGVTASPFVDLPGDSASHSFRVVAVSADCGRQDGNSATRDASDEPGDPAPVFAGIVSATDRDSCRDDGVALAWDPAVFGPAGGAYDVYRDGVRIAQGVTASPYLDLPGDSTTHTYRVVAVSADCGREDGNPATRDASDQIGDRPVFSGIVSATDLDSCGDDGIELAWDPATFGPDGGAYDVYRDGVRIAQGVTASPYTDLPGDSSSHSFRVVAVSADCALEDGNSSTRDAADDAGDPAPVFAGIASATDADPCALDGVTLAWSPAVFGPAGGAYDVYRDGVRIVQGVPASPFVDLPGDSASHSFRIVAVSADCGRVDGNSITRDAADDAGDPAPVFAGIVSATDLDSCRDDGVELSWDPAVFGPAGGAYDVYRDGLRVAQGVTASPYVDLPGDSASHPFRVVAVSADCSRDDGNSVTRDAADDAGDPAPVFAGIVSATDLDSCRDDGVELSWDPAVFGPAGGAYDVYRDGLRVAQGVTASLYLDLPGDSATHAYRVVAISTDCGREDGNSITRDADDDPGDPAPVFDGIASALDLDSCRDDGVELAWDLATFGPDGGAYDVYRDGVRIAQGVTASPYLDLPGDSTTHTYRVVAVSADCGREDGNSATRDASDQIGDRPVFSGIVSATDLDSCRDDGVELAWDLATFGPDGGAYDVYRDGVRIAQGVPGSPYTDLPGDSANHSFRVVAVSADCAREDGNSVTRDAADQTGDPAPVFAGIVAALDIDRCALTGIEVHWDPAGFGSAGGTYAVLRDGIIVASGLTGSPWLDLPGDSAIHDYRVIATGGCGRSAGDDEVRSAADVVLSVDPLASPRDLGNTLRAVRTGTTLALSWAEIPEAATYNLRRGDRKGDWTAPPIATGLRPPTAVRPDLSEPGPLLFYRASASSCSGTEGP